MGPSLPRYRSLRLVALCAIAGGICLAVLLVLHRGQPPETLIERMREAAVAGRYQDLLAYANAHTRAEGNYERFRPTLAEEQVIATLAPWGRSPIFSVADLHFLEGAQLLRAAAGRIAADLPGLRERSGAVFQWLMDHADVDEDTAPAAADRLPADVLLDGRGTPAQLAWTYAALLTSARVPAALVEVDALDSPGSRRLLVGVLDGAEVLLYDPLSGVPIDGPALGRAATLREIAADPNLVDGARFNGMGYAFSGSALRRAQVWLAYEPERLVSRTRVLAELVGPAAGLGVLHCEYVSDSRLWMRALAGGHLETATHRTAQVDLWRYPFEVHGRTVRAPASQPGSGRNGRRERALDPWRRHLLLGNPGEARRGLVDLVEHGRLGPGEQDAGWLFAAQALVDAREYEAGRAALVSWLKRWPESRWRDFAGMLAARAAAAAGDPNAARAAFAAVAGPRALRARYLAALVAPAAPPSRPATAPGAP